MLTYAIRHAQSQFNTGAAASLDSELSDLGVRQVEALVRRFAGIRPRAVYSSPYRRCLLTAIPLARQHGMKVRIRPELCEFHNLATGSTPEFSLERPQNLADRYEQAHFEMAFAECRWPDLAETRKDMIARLRSLADHLKATWTAPDDVVLVISHGSPIARLIDAWLSDEPGPSFRFIIDNATVNALRFENGVRSLICLNEASHLSGLPPAQMSNFMDSGAVKPQAPSEPW